ncbi:MAG: hypothetical protein HY288_15140 [Planctomycetia bacterium]|nr:hypothetical protein [Planctomycetia bacterium]
MKSWLRIIKCSAGVFCTCMAFVCGSNGADAQTFQYNDNPRSRFTDGSSYSSPDPAPRMMPVAEGVEGPLKRRSYLYPRYGNGSVSQRAGYETISPGSRRGARRDFLRTSGAEPIPAGQAAEPFYDDLPPEGAMNGAVEGDPSFDDYGGEDGCCEPCDVGLIGILKRSCLFSPLLWQNFNEFGGVQAFKGPVDRGINGNFGFHKGVNWASPLWDAAGIGYQLGGQIAASDFEGTSGPFNHHREQYFATTGFFHRAACDHGWQGGAVADYLHDNFYVHFDLWQVRSEISYLACGNEVGFWAAAHTRSDTKTGPATFEQNSVTFRSTDQYNFFYRRHFGNGGIGRMWVGFTGHGDAIFGSDVTAPLSERWAIQASYNYLLPRQDPNVPKNIQESFGVAVSLVWYPGYKVPNACFNPYRPLFNVADNGTFMVRERR